MLGLGQLPRRDGAAPDPAQHGRLAAGDVVAGLLVAHPAGEHQDGRPERGNGGVGVRIGIRSSTAGPLAADRSLI